MENKYNCCRREIHGNTPRESSKPMTILPVFTFCWVQFRSADAYTKESNLLLPITTSTGVWQLHIFKDFNMAKPRKDAFPHQILLEFKELPTCWENLIIVEEFFKIFGKVAKLLYPLVLVKTWAKFGHFMSACCSILARNSARY